MWGPKDYRDCVKNAASYKAIGENKIYLSDGSVYPWDHVTKVEDGGSHRMDIATGIRFTAEIDGLSFDWTFDIEPHSANGKGHYEIDVAACREVLGKVPAAARFLLKQHFATLAGKVQEKGQEWQRYADRQKRDADILHSLATLTFS